MRAVLTVVAAAVFLAAAQAAQAGGWATVVLAPPPSGLEAGETWSARLTVLRHGRTPTDGASPSLTIRSEANGSRTYAAEPAGEVGVYVAQVVFPGGGTWRYEASDGLAATGYGISQTHTFGTAEIAPDSAGGSGGVPAWPLALAAILVVAGGAIALVRRRDRRPAPQASR